MAVVLRGTGTLTSGEVAERANIPYRTLMRLVERGLLRPEKVIPAREKIAFIWTQESAVFGQIVGSCGITVSQRKNQRDYVSFRRPFKPTGKR